MLWLMALVAVICRAGGAAAPDGEPSPGFALVSTRATSEGHPVTVALEYREVGFPFQHQVVRIAERQQPFAREPAPGPGKVVRGTLSPGGDTNSALAFLWDCGKHELRLDFNGNGDLTDDPQGVFASRDPNPSYQTFTNVYLSSKGKAASFRVLGDLVLHNYGSQPGSSLGMRSYWSGKAFLNGKDYEAGFVAYPAPGKRMTENGFLLLRPWAARESPFNLDGNSLEGFKLTRNLFLDHQAFEVEPACTETNGAPVFSLTFKPMKSETGEVRLTGEFVDRVLLAGGPAQAPFTVVLDRPAAIARVPVGSYGLPRVRLETRGVRAFRKQVYTSPAAAFSVSATKPAVLALGGPLTNRVAVAQRGGRLQLDYSLVGAGEQPYELAAATNRPQFAVYRGGAKIHSGNFEFG